MPETKPFSSTGYHKASSIGVIIALIKCKEKKEREHFYKISADSPPIQPFMLKRWININYIWYYLKGS